MYKDSIEVSNDHDKDRLYCEVNLTLYANEQKYIAPYTILETEVPRQNPSPEDQRLLDFIAEANSASSTLTFSTWIIQWLQGSSLNHLWSLMDVIVLMNQLVLLRVLMPENSLEMVNEVNEIVGF